MTPEKRAIQLVNKFKDVVLIDYRGNEEPIFSLQKEAALICVNEIMSELKIYESAIHYTTYWKQVKKSIQNL